MTQEQIYTIRQIVAATLQDIQTDSLSFNDNTNFIRMYSPDGTPWIITVDNAGALVITEEV